ncbi:Transcriptional regulator, AbiEi antitoxin, Type IV TA system [Nocardioides scoriae]|uniref:Transcriptional regulator, AbiEi antitoxin, Type IV TA system n=1 Tax=Nocardioides scoriae TaxID=642780 RepID=A0A1H1X2B7_9ACTN|nr:hypothetical protein [Nocardioides scoriae]SDT03438.1 Transcriptional regulator, AbiEi antitoxin, Type IV TA system [Nocardioides scoriae]
MEVGQAVRELGGLASREALLRVVAVRDLERAVVSGEVVRMRRGVYGLPGLDADRAAAIAIGGPLSHLSAALAHGWKVRLPPERPQVMVPRGRNVAQSRRRGVGLRWGAVTPQELVAGIRGEVATVLDCARDLPLEDALAVADSALRAGVPRGDLLRACSRLPRTGRSRALEVVELADARAANPFESVVRAVLLGVPGTCFEPQQWIGTLGRADLLDRRLRLAVEADSFEFHADAAALRRDTERYNAFVGEGYRVVRFAWAHAMFDQDYVRATVTAAARVQERSVRSCGTCTAA